MKYTPIPSQMFSFWAVRCAGVILAWDGGCIGIWPLTWGCPTCSPWCRWTPPGEAGWWWWFAIAGFGWMRGTEMFEGGGRWEVRCEMWDVRAEGCGGRTWQAIQFPWVDGWPKIRTLKFDGVNIVIRQMFEVGRCFIEMLFGHHNLSVSGKLW